jgi:outer membrane protein, multidrug efflux system
MSARPFAIGSKRLRQALLPLAFLAGVSSAAFADEWPAVATPAHYKGQRSASAPEPSAALSGGAPWWEIFHDATLDRLERSALEANQDLRQAVGRVLEARAQARQVAADFFPTLTAPLHATRERTTNTGPITRSRIIGSGFFPTTGATGETFPDTFAGQALTNTFNDFQTELSLSYEIDVFGRIRHNYGQALAAAQATAAERCAVELSLTAQVAANYFNLRSIDAQTDILRRTVRLRTDAVQIQGERVRAGAASDLDLARAQLEQANTEAALAGSVQQRNAAENALAVLCGRPASEFHLAPQALGERPPPAIPAGLPAQLLSRRPDLIEAERKFAGSSEGVKTARAEFLPTFTVQANYGYESANSDQWFQGQSRTWSITGGISIPIFEGGRNVANLKGAQARRDEAAAAYKQTALTAFREAEDSLDALRQQSIQAEARSRASTSARRVFTASEESYREGSINYFEVIDAERALLDAELSEAQTLAARYEATIDLIRALGGGYGGAESGGAVSKKPPGK